MMLTRYSSTGTMMASPSPSPSTSASASSGKKTGPRPGPLRSTKSFPRGSDPAIDAPSSTEAAAAAAANRPRRAASSAQNGGGSNGGGGGGGGGSSTGGAGKTDIGAPPRRAFTNPQVQEESPAEPPDAFESKDDDEAPEQTRGSVDMGELPIELISLTDSFIDSLSAKVHPTPPNIEKLSRLFQDFYALASTHINTHIATLISRQSREQSPARPPAPRSASSMFRSKAASLSGKDKDKQGRGGTTSTQSTPAAAAAAAAGTRTPEPEQRREMITASELADRRRARRAIESKRGVLEEAVERRLCEGIYGRIYRHRSTQDEAQDDKLRSKTAALAVVGIGPADLGVDLGLADEGTTPEAAAAKSAEIGRWLFEARRGLIRMAESRYPLGKLNHLKSVHKSIVDTLAHFHPSSSADEIMPMLIYTLITLQPDRLAVISDLYFIQRFRWEHKLFGEAAYCLTNLEAAIAFLETVDLSTLRADESPSGPPKLASTPATPRTETFPPAYSSGLSVVGGGGGSTGNTSSNTTTITTTTTTTTANMLLTGITSTGTVVAVGEVSTPSADGAADALAAAGAALGPPPSPSASSAAGLRASAAMQQLRSRRLSDLIQTPAQAIGGAADAVRTSADAGLKNISSSISNSLGESYKFLWGRLQQQQADSTAAAAAAAAGTVGAAGGAAMTSPTAAAIPQTLDEARKLVSTPPPAGDEDGGSASGSSSMHSPEETTTADTAAATAAAKAAQAAREDRVLHLIGGRKPSSAARDRSADSSRSAGSSTVATSVRGAKAVSFTSAGADHPSAEKDKTASGLPPASSPSPAPSAASASASNAAAVVESMRSLGSSLNPMSRIAGISMMRGFGRSSAGAGANAAATPPTPPAKDHHLARAGLADGGDLASAFPDLADSLPPKEPAEQPSPSPSPAVPKIAPPIRRFVELQNPGELRIAEVLELLRDYRRLAGALKDMNAFKEV